MRKLALFVVGSVCGIVLGGAAALLFSPDSGDGMRRQARQQFDAMLEDAQAAAEARRVELEAQLAELTRP